MRFDNQHLVIVGGSSGIGLETARIALGLGATVTIAGRSDERLLQGGPDFSAARSERSSPM